jgi:hypothetical protein
MRFVGEFSSYQPGADRLNERCEDEPRVGGEDRAQVPTRIRHREQVVEERLHGVAGDEVPGVPDGGEHGVPVGTAL